MNKSQIMQAQKDNKLFIEDYIAIISNLNDWNIGGIPMEFFATSEQFALTHCSLMSVWLANILPNTSVVEGEAESYKEFKNPDNPSARLGYHSWIEYTDSKDGICKVFDPVNFLVIDKDYYYQVENIKPISKMDNNEVQSALQTKPNQDKLVNKYDIYRQTILLSLFENFVKNDNGVFDEQLKSRFKLYKSEINFDKNFQDFKNEFNVGNTSKNTPLEEAIEDLFYDEKYITPKSDEQVVVFDIIFEHLLYLEKRNNNKPSPTQPQSE